MNLEELMSVATSDLDIDVSNVPLFHRTFITISSYTWHCQHLTNFVFQQNCFFKHERCSPLWSPRSYSRQLISYCSAGWNLENVRVIMQRAILRFYRRNKNKEDRRVLPEGRDEGTRRTRRFAPPCLLIVHSRDNMFYACTLHITTRASLVDFFEELKYCWLVGWRVYSS
jgi:hypothetical protein